MSYSSLPRTIPDDSDLTSGESGKHIDSDAGGHQSARRSLARKIIIYVYVILGCCFVLLLLLPLVLSRAIRRPGPTTQNPLSSGNALWYNSPGSSWFGDFLPIGNGYLGAMIPGGTINEATQLNIESLWTGGPFSDPSYNGGNKQPSERTALAKYMQDIRRTISSSPMGEIESVPGLGTAGFSYGSYAGAGYLLTSLALNGSTASYQRWLDLDDSVARTTWKQSELSFLRESFCSHPRQACVQRLTANMTIPLMTYRFGGEIGLPTPTVTCLDNATLVLRGRVSEPGMLYELIGRVNSTGGSVICNASGTSNASITVAEATDTWIAWVGGTEYDINAGDEAHGFSFKGPDPHENLRALLDHVSATPYADLLAEHIRDYKSVINPFSLSIDHTPNLSTPTDELKNGYKVDQGDIHLEWLLFNYCRYLMVAGARGTLPLNLQGKWAAGASSIWSSDYHANINLQMNYWPAEMMGLDVVKPLFNFMEKTWAPRGSQTAKVLYNISRGWVTHDEMNIFGHTGMKLDQDSAQWANYPESAAWMMMHVWDHFDYTNDVEWWKAQGWPLIKEVASFNLDKLIPDDYFRDSTLVVNPCNSPEQRPVTFGCAHSQQLILQLLDAVEKGFNASGDTDDGFLEEVRTKRTQMDKGIRIGSWGQLQEWKIDRDREDDTHRHMAHLIGLYPGYVVANYGLSQSGMGGGNYTKNDVLQAVEISLRHRGNGTGPDADAGWEKVWRAACWAQLGRAEEFYHMLSYAIERNFAPNLFSVYQLPAALFQIDANFGYPAAVLNALIQAPDVPSLSIPLIVTLLPALPSKWPSGSVTGVRVRGGMSIDLWWSAGKAKRAVVRVDKNVTARDVKIVYAGKVVKLLSTAGLVEEVILF